MVYLGQVKLKKAACVTVAFLAVTILICQSIFAIAASPPSTEWSRTFGGSGADYAYRIIQALDGGYAMAGNTASFSVGGTDCYFVKIAAENQDASPTESPTTNPTATPVVPEVSFLVFLVVMITITSFQIILKKRNKYLYVRLKKGWYVGCFLFVEYCRYHGCLKHD